MCQESCSKFSEMTSKMRISWCACHFWKLWREICQQRKSPFLVCHGQIKIGLQPHWIAMHLQFTSSNPFVDISSGVTDNAVASKKPQTVLSHWSSAAHSVWDQLETSLLRIVAEVAHTSGKGTSASLCLLINVFFGCDQKMLVRQFGKMQ